MIAVYEEGVQEAATAVYWVETRERVSGVWGAI